MIGDDEGAVELWRNRGTRVERDDCRVGRKVTPDRRSARVIEAALAEMRAVFRIHHDESAVAERRDRRVELMIGGSRVHPGVG